MQRNILELIQNDQLTEVTQLEHVPDFCNRQSVIGYAFRYGSLAMIKHLVEERKLNVSVRRMPTPYGDGLSESYLRLIRDRRDRHMGVELVEYLTSLYEHTHDGLSASHYQAAKGEFPNIPGASDCNRHSALSLFTDYYHEKFLEWLEMTDNYHLPHHDLVDSAMILHKILSNIMHPRLQGNFEILNKTMKLLEHLKINFFKDDRRFHFERNFKDLFQDIDAFKFELLIKLCQLNIINIDSISKCLESVHVGYHGLIVSEMIVENATKNPVFQDSRIDSLDQLFENKSWVLNLDLFIKVIGNRRFSLLEIDNTKIFIKKCIKRGYFSHENTDAIIRCLENAWDFHSNAACMRQLQFPQSSVNQLLAIFQYHRGEIPSPFTREQISSHQIDVSPFEEHAKRFPERYSEKALFDFIHPDNELSALVELRGNKGEDLLSVLAEVAVNTDIPFEMRIHCVELLSKYEKPSSDLLRAVQTLEYMHAEQDKLKQEVISLKEKLDKMEKMLEKFSKDIQEKDLTPQQDQPRWKCGGMF